MNFANYPPDSDEEMDNSLPMDDSLSMDEGMGDNEDTETPTTPINPDRIASEMAPEEQFTHDFVDNDAEAIRDGLEDNPFLACMVWILIFFLVFSTFGGLSLYILTSMRSVGVRKTPFTKTERNEMLVISILTITAISTVTGLSLVDILLQFATISCMVYLNPKPDIPLFTRCSVFIPFLVLTMLRVSFLPLLLMEPLGMTIGLLSAFAGFFSFAVIQEWTPKFMLEFVQKFLQKYLTMLE